MSALGWLTRWLDALASLFTGWRDLWRARRTVVVTQEDGQLVLRPSGQNAAVLAAAPLGSRLSDEALKAAGRGFVVLELAPGKVLGRRLTVPGQARAFLAGIVQNQIERLSPWPLDQAAYGFSAAGAADQGGQLDVRVVIAARAAVEAASRIAVEGGLSVDRVDARVEGDVPCPAVPLWSRTADAAGSTTPRARWAVAAALAAIVAASAGGSFWALSTAAALAEESEAIGVRVKALQRQAQGLVKSAAGTVDAAERAWTWKAGAPAAVILLDALSQALPDSAHLTEFNLQGSNLRIVGLASDSPALIGQLEASGHFSDVRFFAPTIRGPDGVLLRFHIEARVQSRLEVAAR